MRCGLHLFYFIVKGETKMSVTIEVRDRRGDAVSAVLCPVTNNVVVTLPDSKPFYVDPKDPEALAWLKVVFGSQLDFII